MNSQSPSSPPSPRDLFEELAALSGVDALDGDDLMLMEHSDECPAAQMRISSLGFEATAAAIALSEFPPVEPPASVRDDIFEKIMAQEEDDTPEGYHLITDKQGDWQSLPGGKIRLKILSDLDELGHSTMMLEAALGAIFFPHAHRGMEEVIMIEGELETIGKTLKPGDYLRASAGTRHAAAKSPKGCRAILVTARENHPRKAISLYNKMASVFRKDD